MDAFAAGRLSRSIDPFHSVTYFMTETAERFSAIGMAGLMPYFAARSAPMGEVGARVVAATFYNFNPALITDCIPAAWQLASPQQVNRLRYEIIEDALPRVLGELTHSPEIARTAVVLRIAAEAIPNGDGRPLYAGHAELPWPDSPHGQLWHAVTLLREYRGDGHIAALLTHGLSGLEALITHTASGIGFSTEFARRLRGWTREQWAAAAGGLRVRGLLDDAGDLTRAGVDLRSRIENLTDALAYEPWRSVPDDQVDEVARVAMTVRAAVLSAGQFPAGAFGPRYGEHR